MAMGESWPPALAPGMAPFLSTPTLSTTQRPHVHVCMDTHNLHIPALPTCPANSSTVAPLRLGRVIFRSYVLPCLLWSWLLSSYLCPLNPPASAANYGGWDGSGSGHGSSSGHLISMSLNHLGAVVPAPSLSPGLAEAAGRQPLPQQMKQQARK